MEPPTEHENVLILQLRQRLEDLELDEIEISNQELLRWIRAREHDVEKAEIMFRKSVAWRLEIDAKGLLSWEPDEHLATNFTFTISGFDYEGCPVLVAQAGKMDFRTAFDDGYLDEGLKYAYKCLEQLVCLLRKHSGEQKCMKKIIAIIDCEGLQFRQLTSRKLLEEFAKLLSLYEANYPETLKAAIIVNVPTIFAIAYRIICRILSPITLSKVQIHNYCVSKYSAQIQKLMASEEFPEKYGGSGLMSTNYMAQDFLNSNSE